MTKSRIEENFKLFDFELSPEEMAVIREKAAFDPVGVVNPGRLPGRL